MSFRGSGKGGFLTDRMEFANEDNGGARGSVLDFQDVFFCPDNYDSSLLKFKIEGNHPEE